MRTSVIEGAADGMDLVGLLQVISLGRQYTEVILKRDHVELGTIRIKAGKVLSANADGRSGREALFQLMQKRHSAFQVFRYQTPPELPEPIGSIEELLIEALEQPALGGAPSAGSVEEGSVLQHHLESVSPDPAGSPSFRNAAPAPVSQKFTQPPKRAGSAPPKSSISAPPPQALTSSLSAPAPALGEAPARSRTSLPPPLSAKSVRPSQRPSSPSRGRAGELRSGDQRAGATPGELAGQAAKAGRTSGSPALVLGIVSPKGGSGKTTVSLNLSISLARQGHRVILVDADINGDVLSSINARDKAVAGVFDALLKRVDPTQSLLPTILPTLSILPAVGPKLPSPTELMGDLSAAWKTLLEKLRPLADIIVVDTPSGMYGTTHQVLRSATHTLGILQAESVAHRSFSMFREGLNALPSAQQPAVVGVLLNMLQTRHNASLAVLQSACSDFPESWLLETSIPRSSAFLDATGDGLPLRLMDDQAPPAVSWLFDTLALEVVQRIGLAAVSEARPKSLLL